MLLVARFSFGRDLVDPSRRVILEVTSRLLTTQGLLTCLGNETISNEHHQQREAEDRRDAQQAV